MTLFLNYKKDRVKSPTLSIISDEQIDSIKLFGSDDLDYLNTIAKYMILYNTYHLITNSSTFCNYTSELNKILISQENNNVAIIEYMEN